jgi:capsular polysaccharide biosynthesis protein
LGLAFSAEQLDRSIKTPEQAKLQLGLPVLLTVPRSRAFKHSVVDQVDQLVRLSK